ncbi:MAG: hypothetical protein ABIW82_03000 [Dokdonella sp.]
MNTNTNWAIAALQREYAAWRWQRWIALLVGAVMVSAGLMQYSLEIGFMDKLSHDAGAVSHADLDLLGAMVGAQTVGIVQFLIGTTCVIRALFRWRGSPATELLLQLALSK